VWSENILRKLQAILLFVFVLTGCQKPSEIRTYNSSGNLSYRVDFYGGQGAAAPSSTAVFAVLKTSAGSSEKLVLSGTYMDIDSINWNADGQGSICLSGGYTETYRRIVALTVGAETKAVYTHLSDNCSK
jgi:hypothetical protein